MADNATDYKSGFVFEDAEYAVVKYSETIIPGDLLMITGVNSEYKPIVARHTGSGKARFVAIRDGDANSPGLSQVLRRGRTKLTFGGTVAAGDTIAPNNNKVVEAGWGGGGARPAPFHLLRLRQARLGWTRWVGGPLKKKK